MVIRAGPVLDPSEVVKTGKEVRVFDQLFIVPYF